MQISPLPFRSNLKAYEQQAADLLAAWQAGDTGAVKLIRENYPRFLDEKIPWLPKRLSDAAVRSVTLDLPDAQLATARWYSFQSWPRLAQWAEFTAWPEGSTLRVDQHGPRSSLRITYYDIAKDHFRWKADVSQDGGKTWNAEQIRIEAKRAN